MYRNKVFLDRLCVSHCYYIVGNVLQRLFIIVCIFFFFQAEDGIRDAQESRGLGDVYKRQHHLFGYGVAEFENTMYHNFFVRLDSAFTLAYINAVSYTHLTLPTIYSV